MFVNDLLSMCHLWPRRFATPGRVARSTNLAFGTVSGGRSVYEVLERIRRELARICEFCETAENGASALETLMPLRIKYNLVAGVMQ